MRFKLNEATLDSELDKYKDETDAAEAERQEKIAAARAERKAREAAFQEKRDIKADTARARWEAHEAEIKNRQNIELSDEDKEFLRKYAEPKDEVAYYAGDIEKALDKIYKSAMRQKKKEQINLEHGTSLRLEFPCLWLIGDAGTGKTSRVHSWCEENGLTMVEKSLSTLEETDLGGAIAADLEKGKAVRLSSDEFDELDDNYTVLFLDEYLRGRMPVRQTLLNLINHHVVPDKHHKGGMRYFPKLLFVVGATNPAGEAYEIDTDFDTAEKTRGMTVHVESDKNSFLWNFRKGKRAEIRAAIRTKDIEWAKELENKLIIGEALASSPMLDFDDEEEVVQVKTAGYSPLNARSLSKLIEDSDGTVDDIIDSWDYYCNPAKKQIAENILNDIDDLNIEEDEDEFDADGYDELDDKANSVFKKKEKSAWDEIGGLLD